MSLLDRINDRLFSSRKLEYVVKTYGPDFLSTYGGGALLAAGAAFAGSAAPWIAIPAAAGLVSFVNQMDHNYRERGLLEFYRDQVAVAAGKPAADVTLTDLHAMAEGKSKLGDCPNNILKYEIENNDRRRNYAIGLHAVAAGLFGLVAGAVLPLLSGLPELPLAQLSLGFGGLLLYQQIDHAVSDIGRVMFDVSRTTAHERIVEMENTLHTGQRVRRMQVFALMVDADKGLAADIKKEYGTRFGDLYLSDKYKALEKFGAARHVEALTQALNAGGMEAEDLVLTVCNRAPAPKPRDYAGAIESLEGPGQGHAASTYFQDTERTRREAVLLGGEMVRGVH